MQKIIQDRNVKLLADISANRITLLDGRFYFTEPDEKGEIHPIPSVTTILDCYPKGPAFYEWLKKNGEEADNIMNSAGRRGSRIHDLTERYDKGEKITLMNENGNLDMSLLEWAMFERYVDFTKRFQPDHKSIEMNIVSKKLNCAGTLDRPCTYIPFLQKTFLIDIKTSPQIYDHFWVQLAAYEKMLYEETKVKVDGIAILHLNAKIRTENPKEVQGIGWKLYVPDKPNNYYWDLFKATQNLWYAQNGNLVPKSTEYQLSHQISKSPKKKTNGKK